LEKISQRGHSTVLLSNGYYQFIKTKRIRMRRAGQVKFGGELRNAYRILVGNPEGKRPHGIIGSSWDDVFEDDHEETV
jgi:hypothetical protein